MRSVSRMTTSHGLEKLSVPTWDGNRKSYATWKSEFNYWIYKYKQDEDEQLQRLRKALPKNSFWSDQVRPSKKIEQARKILDTKFGDQRKLMDKLLNEITNLKPIKNDSNSLSRYAARRLSFVNNMEQNGCEVTSTSEAPFVMSQPLSKLDACDNIEFGREMLRMGKEENALNLIDWLNKEASLRSRIKRDTNYRNNSRDHRSDNREFKHQAFLTTRTWGDRVETKSKTAFLAPMFVLSTRLPATDAAAKFKKCKRQCKHWFSRGNLRIREQAYACHGGL